jgi:hypothetical protein
MALVRKYQNNFTAGELSPGVSARTDLSKYGSGCAELVNGIVLPHGGVTKRPGTLLVDSLPGKGLLLPFTYSVDQTYALVFFGKPEEEHAFMRIYADGAVLLVPGTANTYEIETPYAPEDLGKLKFVQSADTMFFAHPHYPVYKLARFGTADWRFSELVFKPNIQPPSALSVSATKFSDSSGTYVKTTADYVVASVDAQEVESLPCEPVTADILSTWPSGARVNLAWEPVVEAVRYEVYKNTRGYYAWIGSTKDLEFTDDNIEGDDTLGPKEYRDPFHGYNAPEGTYITGGSNAEVPAGQIIMRFAYGNNSGVIGVASPPITTNKALEDIEVTIPRQADVDRYYAYWTTDESTPWVAACVGEYEGSEMKFTNVAIQGSVSVNVLKGDAEFTMSAIVEGQEGRAAPAIARNVTPLGALAWVSYRFTWTAVPEAERYVLYRRTKLLGDESWAPWTRYSIDAKDANGKDITSFTISLTTWETLAENGDPIENSVRFKPYQQPYLDYTPKDVPDNFPGAIGLYQQRLVFGRSDAEPQTVWLSETGSFDSMAVATPLRDDSAITATVDTRQMNEIRHFIALRDMLMLTSGAEFKMQSGSANGAITPTSIAFPIQSYWGVSDLPPIVSGTSILLVQNSNRHVRDLQYTLQEDGYSGNEVSILAEHLFDADIVDWAYQQSPYSTVWVCLANGKLLTFTYMREQEIWAWSRHESSGGKFISVTSIREGAQDSIYYLVERDGRFFVEYQIPRSYGDRIENAFYVDCGLRYDGDPIQHVTGMEHLAGKEIAVLADGSALLGVTVSADGSFDLQAPARRIAAGLPYTFRLKTLDPEIRSEEGPTTGEKKAVVRAVLYLRETRNFRIGPDDNLMVEAKLPTQKLWDSPPPLFTGVLNIPMPGAHREEATLTIVATDPVPCTILGLNKYISIG